jgi:hypothetical protein
VGTIDRDRFRADPDADWAMIALAHPVLDVLRHLSAGQLGELPGWWSAATRSVASALGELWSTSDVDRATMIVRSGVGSSTWNVFVGAVWASLPLSREVLDGTATCTRSDVEAACRAHGVDPARAWTAPRGHSLIASFRPTPELVHGVAVSDPLWAMALRVRVRSAARHRAPRCSADRALLAEQAGERVRW